MYNSKKKRGCKSQGGCTANGASRPTGDRFKTWNDTVKWAKEYLAQYGYHDGNPDEIFNIPEEAMEKIEFWQAMYYKQSERWQQTDCKLFEMQNELGRTKRKLKSAEEVIAYLGGKLHEYNEKEIVEELDELDL